jgi:hypothetical protein
VARGVPGHRGAGSEAMDHAEDACALLTPLGAEAQEGGGCSDVRQEA